MRRSLTSSPPGRSPTAEAAEAQPDAEANRRREAGAPLTAAVAAPWPRTRPRYRRDRVGEDEVAPPNAIPAARRALRARRRGRVRAGPRSRRAQLARGEPRAWAAEDRSQRHRLSCCPRLGFLRVPAARAVRGRLYISTAQVPAASSSRRWVPGPVRSPPPLGALPALIRVDTITRRSRTSRGGTKYDDLPCTYATERIALDSGTRR